MDNQRMQELEDAVFHLARLGLDGKRDDIAMFVRRMVYWLLNSVSIGKKRTGGQ